MKKSLKACRNESGFSHAEWSSFLRTVRKRVTDPDNYIGLEGIKVHKEAWEVWIDNFLDAEMGKQYWGILKGKKWVFSRDREVIRKFLRTVVMLVAKRKRRSHQPTPGERVEEDGDDRSVEGEDPGEDVGEYDTLEEGGAKDKDFILKGSEVKTGSSSGLGANGPEDSTCTIVQPPVPPAKGISQSAWVPRPPVIFSTRVTTVKNPDMAYKFVYTEESPPLPVFLEEVHRKHKLVPAQKISNLRVQVGDKLFTIDLDSPERYWDWDVIMGISGKMDCFVEIILAID